MVFRKNDGFPPYISTLQSVIRLFTSLRDGKYRAVPVSSSKGKNIRTELLWNQYQLDSPRRRAAYEFKQSAATNAGYRLLDWEWTRPLTRAPKIYHREVVTSKEKQLWNRIQSPYSSSYGPVLKRRLLSNPNFFGQISSHCSQVLRDWQLPHRLNGVL